MREMIEADIELPPNLASGEWDKYRKTNVATWTTRASKVQMFERFKIIPRSDIHSRTFSSSYTLL